MATTYMQTAAITPEEYISELPEDRKQAMTQLRSSILKNLPNGFKEIISTNMISYVVPHSLYSKGYHCDPKQPLPFLSIASQKNFVAIYHMGIYADKDLLNWFREAYGKNSKTKLDMGKSCIRFKRIEQIPFELIGELVSKMTPQKWIETYEREFKKG
jgi:hypothetical protein